MAERIDTGVSGQSSVEEIRRQVERFSKLLHYEGADKVITWQDYLKDSKDEAGRKLVISCGFPELDAYLEGFQTGELITISGYTGMGKSLFLKSLIRSFGIQEVPTGIFCFEDSATRYVEKFQIENASYPIYLPRALKMGDINWLEDRILEAKVKYDCHVIAIDHLGYLTSDKMTKDNLSNVLGHIMRKLKRIAEDHNLCVIVVAHQRKADEASEEASLETIRDSGLIGNESDAVIVVQRLPDVMVKKFQDATYDNGFALVKVEKSRRTGTYRKRLTFQKAGEWLAPV